ncbi:MAG TPA: site-specific integrase, partial [Burkholderiales bacterium]|nr:site-specific integrase [Burkholderiales bacterium]
LEWSRVDLKANVVRLGAAETKARKERLVPLNQSAREALLRRFRYRATHCPAAPWVFCTKGGKRVAGVRSSYLRACKAAGLSGFRFHDLRHTCGSWLMQAGVPAGHIAAVLGHSTVRMTERYAHVAPENAQAAVALLGGVPKTVPSGETSSGDTLVSA